MIFDFFSNSSYQLVIDDPVFTLKVEASASNYKFGIMVQSLLIGIFSFLAIIHEILAMSSKVFFPFMEKEMARAITHVLNGCFGLGFCGGMGIIASIIEMCFSVFCYITAIVEAWNPENADSPDDYEQSTT